ncbi:hypothetical protein E2F43_13425 [Seongchinamella unica]|uniref:Uncharacterized protein n=1 Tax=Seongchinamella unica TaxID=2547392 RepID=A0A4R5LPX1_9GAMM|nr:hypothetical protein [Seongchinamella unica]TDG12587.1 hypothetical protein E2F43_13425 [Seongchinamella unica]
MRIGRIVLVLTMGCAGTGGVVAQQASLEHCQKLKDGIARYDELRRNGGGGSQMDGWKRSRRKLDTEFRKLGCKYYRGRLE